MRLSERVAVQVQNAIEELPILDAERQTLDYELTPAVANGPDGMVTVFYISLFMPGGLGLDDHITFGEFLQDPYQGQAAVNRIVRGLYDQAVQQQTDSRKQIPGAPKPPQEVVSNTGLYLGR